MENIDTKEGKTMAIISYITIFGTIIAYIMNSSKKNSFASFHIRQMIGIFLLTLVNKYFIYDYLGSTSGWFFGIVIFALWLIGFVSVFNNEEKEIPVFGGYFQKWFAGI